MNDSEEGRGLGIAWPREKVGTQGHGHCGPVTKASGTLGRPPNPRLQIAPLIPNSWVDELLVSRILL